MRVTIHKNYRLVCLIAVLSFWPLKCAWAQESSQADVIDGVAAIVNGDVITFSQVREVVSARERALRNNYSGKELADKIREARLGALRDLIDRQLILQEFRKKDFQIPAHIIEERIQTIIREEFGGDRQAFIRTLQAQGFTLAKFRDAERDKFVVQAMRYSNIKGEFIVSPRKIGAAYDKARPELTSPEQIKLRLIAISKGNDNDKEGQAAQKLLAEEIRAKLVGGANFGQLAQMYSEDSSREAQGDWGWIERKTLNETLSKAAFRLKPKEISPVIEQNGVYYILMVEEKKNAYTKPFVDVRSELEKKLTAEERQRLQEQWIAGLRQKAFIKMF